MRAVHALDTIILIHFVDYLWVMAALYQALHHNRIYQQQYQQRPQSHRKPASRLSLMTGTGSRHGQHKPRIRQQTVDQQAEASWR